MACSIDKKAEFVPEWKGWGEYFGFWDQFVKGWYDCKAGDPNALPKDQLTGSLIPLFDDKNEDFRLSKDELPEPYCIDPGTVGVGESFDPAKVGLVVIQMNPGASQSKNNKKVNLEATKFYSNKDKDEGFLIRDFADKKTCDKKFSKWVERWSCFRGSYPALGCVPPDETVGCGVPPSKVCGHDWWWEENPVRWFRSFAGCELSSIFALETIPYHSVMFNISSAVRKPDFREYLLQRVLLPAGLCAKNSSSKIVVCRGGDLRRFLKGLDCAELVLRWEKRPKSKGVDNPLEIDDKVVEDERQNEITSKWPDRNSVRWYELYRCKIPYSEKDILKICEFLVLSMSANQARFPREEFEHVETLLKKRIEKEVESISEKVSLYVAKDALAGKKDGPVGWMSNPDRIGPVIIDRESLQRLIKDKKD